MFVTRGVIFLLLLASTTPAARISCSPADLWQFRTTADPRIRPDGHWVVYREIWNERETGAEHSNLWIASADGRERRRYTEGKWYDWSPRWSPDGARIAWLSDRSGKPQLRVRRFDSTAEIQLTSGDAEPLAFAWSAEGDALALTARVAAAPAPPAWAPPAILPYVRRPEPQVRIFVIPAAGGAPRQVATGNAACHGEPAWTLDGRSLIAACDTGIYRFPVAGEGAKALTKDAGVYDSPVVSPDGGRIAYLFAERKPQSYTVHKLCVMNADGTRARVLSGSLDRDAADPQWSSESRTVYFLADDRGSTHIYAARNEGTLRQVTATPERLRGLSLADNGRAVSVRSTPTEAGDVVTFTVDVVSQPATLAAPNEHLLADREPGAAEEISYPSDGRTIQAWVVKPPAFDAAHKYPLLLDVADDPRRMYGVEFDLRAQVFAAAGYVVLRVNPRGTPGYGEQFGNLLRTRYPGDDFDDLMRGVDAVVSKGYIDGARIHIAGGLLSAWAIGHTTRFRSAVARRPIADWTADVALSPDGVRRAAEWMGAFPWDDPDQYVKHSPIYFARNFQTPTLILAGEQDSESDELYFALRSRKVEAALVRLPEGGPAARLLELETILAWLRK
jgi:dipeptidyl aminopeptidase/acylaminoacyl peptidase